MTKAINTNKHNIAAGESFTFKNNYYAYWTATVTRVTESSVFHTKGIDHEFRESIATWNKRIDGGKLVARFSPETATLRSELEKQMDALDLHFSETDPDTLAEIIDETLEFIEGYEGDSFAEMVRDYLDDVMSGEGAAAIMQEIDFLAVCSTCADAKEARRNCAECGREWTVDQTAYVEARETWAAEQNAQTEPTENVCEVCGIETEDGSVCSPCWVEGQNTETNPPEEIVYSVQEPDPTDEAITPERIAELQRAERDRRDERATFNAEGF